jgi:hypothetical protein
MGTFSFNFLLCSLFNIEAYIFFFSAFSAEKKKNSSLRGVGPTGRRLRTLRLERICPRQIKRAVNKTLSLTRVAKLGPSAKQRV